MFPGGQLVKEVGEVCALAVHGLRALEKTAVTYPALFRYDVYDASLFASVALANAFSAPWLSAAQQRIFNRNCLWAFAFDLEIDYLATSPDQAREVARRCVAVLDGGTPEAGDQLAEFLAEMRDDLSAAASSDLTWVWVSEFKRSFEAQLRELDWYLAYQSSSDISALPSFEEYLDNSDNIEFVASIAAAWIVDDHPATRIHLEELLTATRAVQKVLRLLNDLGTRERDEKWGDLTPFMLGLSPADVATRCADLMAAADELVQPLLDKGVRAAEVPHRSMKFCAGYYPTSDYWGESAFTHRLAPT